MGHGKVHGDFENLHERRDERDAAIAQLRERIGLMAEQKAAQDERLDGLEREQRLFDERVRCVTDKTESLDTRIGELYAAMQNHGWLVRMPPVGNQLLVESEETVGIAEPPREVERRTVGIELGKAYFTDGLGAMVGEVVTLDNGAQVVALRHLSPSPPAESSDETVGWRDVGNAFRVRTHERVKRELANRLTYGSDKHGPVFSGDPAQHLREELLDALVYLVAAAAGRGGRRMSALNIALFTLPLIALVAAEELRRSKGDKLWRS